MTKPSVLVAALLLGAGVELWGLFPMEHVKDFPRDPYTPFVPRNLALVYHFLNCAEILLQLTCLAAWVWSLYATAAVSRDKFQEFCVQTRYSFDKFLLLTECGQFLFIVNTTILLGALVAATTKDHIVRKIGYIVPLFLAGAGWYWVQQLSSYVGRAAFHGLLLMDKDPHTAISQVGCKVEDKSTPAAEYEKNISRGFRQHNMVCEDSVIDAS